VRLPAGKPLVYPPEREKLVQEAHHVQILSMNGESYRLAQSARHRKLAATRRTTSPPSTQVLAGAAVGCAFG
jgi:hypothetical protein